MKAARNDIADLDKQLSVEDLFTKDREKAVSLGQKRVEIISQLEDLEKTWFDAVDAYEAAKSES